MSDRAVLVPYQEPLTRALATLRRQLILDAIMVALGVVGSIPLEGPVNWRAITLGALALLFKTVMATAAKYDRCLQGQEDEIHVTMESDEDDA